MPARERLSSLAEQEARAYRGQAPSRAHAAGPPAQLLWERFEHGPQSDLGAWNAAPGGRRGRALEPRRVTP